MLKIWLISLTCHCHGLLPALSYIRNRGLNNSRVAYWLRLKLWWLASAQPVWVALNKALNPSQFQKCCSITNPGLWRHWAWQLEQIICIGDQWGIILVVTPCIASCSLDGKCPAQVLMRCYLLAYCQLLHILSLSLVPSKSHSDAKSFPSAPC